MTENNYALYAKSIEQENEFAKVTMTDALESELNRMGFSLGSNLFISNYTGVETSSEARKIAGQFHNYINKGQKWADNLAQAIEAQSQIMATITTMSPDQIIASSGKLAKLGKVIASEGKTGFTVDEKGQITLKGSSGSSGNGDRSNPLPEFESTNAICRGKNGDRVIAIRGDAIPDHEALGLSANFQAFQYAQTGEHKGFLVWKGTLGEQTSWSGLNHAISTEILGLNGSSIGVNGLETISSENLETMRTTQLRGLDQK